MSVSDKYGYRHGQRQPVKMLVDSSSSVPIEVGDMIALATAGYVKQAVAGDKIVGVDAANNVYLCQMILVLSGVV